MMSDPMFHGAVPEKFQATAIAMAKALRDKYSEPIEHFPHPSLGYSDLMGKWPLSPDWEEWTRHLVATAEATGCAVAADLTDQVTQAIADTYEAECAERGTTPRQEAEDNGITPPDGHAVINGPHCSPAIIAGHLVMAANLIGHAASHTATGYSAASADMAGDVPGIFRTTGDKEAEKDLIARAMTTCLHAVTGMAKTVAESVIEVAQCQHLGREASDL